MVIKKHIEVSINKETSIYMKKNTACNNILWKVTFFNYKCQKCNFVLVLSYLPTEVYKQKSDYDIKKMKYE